MSAPIIRWMYDCGTGSVVDVKYKTRARSCCRSETHIATVRENVAESPETSIFCGAQELDISTATLHRILNNYLHLHVYKMQST